jgi:hypothetical protein
LTAAGSPTAAWGADVSVLSGDGDGGFGIASDFGSSFPLAMSSGDIDGDGWVDLVSTN